MSIEQAEKCSEINAVRNNKAHKLYVQYIFSIRLIVFNTINQICVHDLELLRTFNDGLTGHTQMLSKQTFFQPILKGLQVFN
jgi:hypothetical protein